MSIEKVREFFKDTEVYERIIEPEHSSATVDLAAEALGIEPDRIAKTLSFLVHEEPVLVVVSGHARIDNKKYRHYFGAKARMIAGENVEELIGHAPGGVCPFAVNEGVKVYLDVSLKKYEEVYPAAGSGNSAIRMSIAMMEKYSGSLAWIDVCKEETE